ncbi:hypothetical protein GYB29_15905 [bacterium]|jgi:hypothetical protein|nr:hypothetical protein [bacterium]
MKESYQFIKTGEFKDFIELKFDEAFNPYKIEESDYYKFADIYNNANTTTRVTLLANFITIREAINESIINRKEVVYSKEIFTQNVYYYLENYSKEEKQNVAILFDTILSSFIRDLGVRSPFYTIGNNRNFYSFIDEINSVLKLIYVGQNPDNISIFKDCIQSPLEGIITNLIELITLSNKEKVLSNLIYLISKKDFSEEIFSEQIKKITDKNKLGRPLKKKVPQNEITDYLKKKLSTKNKRFIHSTGKYEGLPNWNQLSEDYLNSNPTLTNDNLITKRGLIKRLKRAYELIDTSMN